MMDGDVKKRIEAYLLADQGWVPCRKIKALFDVHERALRGIDGRPGLCSDFAVSSDKGLKHVTLASRTEWLRFKHRLRRHGINELVRVRRLDRRRHAATRSLLHPPMTYEKDTGQAVMALALDQGARP